MFGMVGGCLMGVWGMYDGCFFCVFIFLNNYFIGFWNYQCAISSLNLPTIMGLILFYASCIYYSYYLYFGCVYFVYCMTYIFYMYFNVKKWLFGRLATMIFK